MTHVFSRAPGYVPRWLGAFTLTAMLMACSDHRSSPEPRPVVPTRAVNHLYTETNETHNTVVHFIREADGRLVRQATTATHGAGTNGQRDGKLVPDSLVSQHAIVISTDASRLFAVNAGDQSLSVFEISPTTGALTLLKKNATQAGVKPNSLAYHHGHLYVTFLEGATRFAAYKVGADGSLTQRGAYDLTALAGIPAAAQPTQVLVSPGGKHVIVNAGVASNAIVAFPILHDGGLGVPVKNTAQVESPFAGVFVPGAATPTYLATSISGVGLASFHYQPSTGKMTRINQVQIPHVKDPCWVAVTPNGQLAYVGNASGAISSFRIDVDGRLTLLNAKAAVEPQVLPDIDSVAGDSWISPDGRYLYTAFLGADKVVAYAINADGALSKLNEVVVGTSTRQSLQGLAGL
ncbi:lactonase family protein [Roseateles sp. So40a]|uniref:lactonase family protein n=1 Tax=Roseateles sp. So40a TaxID=3400226 RepID=UPI003A839393